MKLKDLNPFELHSHPLVSVGWMITVLVPACLFLSEKNYLIFAAAFLVLFVGTGWFWTRISMRLKTKPIRLPSFLQKPPKDPEEYIYWATQNNKPTCPDCREGDLVSGPQGGMAVNFACPKCNRRFNMGLLEKQIIFFERTGTVGMETFSNLFQGQTMSEIYKDAA